MTVQLLAQAEDTTVTLNLTQILTVGSIVLTVAMLLWSLSKGRRETRLRPLFDVARVVVQIAVVVAIPFFTGVVTPVLLIVGALLIGLSLGFLQGQHLEVKLEETKIMVRRSVIGFAIWGGGLVLMQAAGLANRTGLVRVGQALSWFSIGITVGVIFGRHTNVDRLVRSAAVTAGSFLLVAAPIGVLFGLDANRPAAAQSCPSPPAGFTFEGLSGENCQYSSSSGETVAVSSSGAGCGADGTEEWTSRGGVVGQDVNVKDDGPGDFGDGFTYFQRYMVRGQNGVVAVASRSFNGGIAQQFIGVAKAYSVSFQPTCTGGGDTGETTGGDNPPPPPVVTRVEVEDIDPNAIPPSQTIPDEGGELFPTVPPPTEPREVGPQNTSPPATTGSGEAGSDDDEGTFVAPPVDEESGADDGGLDDGDEVTEEEALAAAISGLIAAAMAGVITWSEAAANINELLGESGRERNADELIDSVRQQFGQDMAGAPPVDPNDPRTDIFRHPDTGEILISDGSQGAPPGYVWDPWGSRWLSPAEAAAEQARTLTPPLNAHGEPMRVSSGHDRFPDGSPVPPGWVQTADGRWVSPEAARQHVAEQRQELEEEAQRRREWDAETERGRQESAERNEQLAQERREREEAEAREREAARAASGPAYEQLDRIHQAAERRGWDDVIDRMDNAFDENGNIRPEYVDQLADLVSNRIAEEIMRGSPTPSMLAETLRSLDEDYGDLLLGPPFGPYIREQLLDGIQTAMEETYFGEAVSGSLNDMRNSTALRLLSGIATGGASEVVYQSADLGEAILRDIDQAIKDGVPAERFAVLEQTARTLIENNTPINTARLVFGDKPVTPTEALIAIVGDVGALFDIGTAGQRGTVLAEMPWQRGLDAHVSTAAGDMGRAARETVDRLGGAGTSQRIGDAATEASRRAQRGLQGFEDAIGVNPNPGARGGIPESARRAVDGDGRFGGIDDGIGARAGDAHVDVPPPGSINDDWLRDAPPGSRIDPDRIREAGYTPKQAEALREVAAKHGVLIGTRTTNIHSTQFIENGTAVPKPVWMKPKTINELDELLGGPSKALQGQVGYFPPKMPDPPYPAGLEARHAQRLEEFNKLTKDIADLEAKGLATVKDGVVHKVISAGPPVVTKPFAGDIDGVVILKPDGTPVTGAQYDEIVRDLQGSHAMVQHGAEANLIDDLVRIKTEGLEPGSPAYYRAAADARESGKKLFDSLDKNHLTGKEQVIWTGPNGHTKGGQLSELGGYDQLVRGRWADTQLPHLLRPNQDDQ